MFDFFATLDQNAHYTEKNPLWRVAINTNNDPQYTGVILDYPFPIEWFYRFSHVLTINFV